VSRKRLSFRTATPRLSVKTWPTGGLAGVLWFVLPDKTSGGCIDAKIGSSA